MAAFLDGIIPFNGIAATIEAVLKVTPERRPESIKEVLACDAEARQKAREVAEKLGRAAPAGHRAK